MENIFVEFLPPWIETGLQPAFYDKESGTVLQQTARMYARVNMLIRMFNKLSKNTKTEVERFETAVNEDMTQYKHDINETVADYIEKFNQLHDYVHDYFDNLDVQEEINNKLDQMMEDGVLQEIISQFLQSTAIWCFDTVADMQAATNLIDGSFAKTLGYYSVNDDGGALYKITDTTPSGYYETLNSGLYAELIIDDCMNVKQFGCKGDDTNNDTTKFNVALDKCKRIFVPNGTYRIDRFLPKDNQEIYGVGEAVLKLVGSLAPLCVLSSNLILQNLHIASDNENLQWNRCDISNKEDITITDCIIEGFRHDSQTPNAWGILIGSSSRIAINSCYFDNNSQSDIALTNGCKNISINQCNGSAFYINIEPNDALTTNDNIAISNCDLNQLNLLENSYTGTATQSVLVSNSHISLLKYDGGTATLINTIVDDVVNEGTSVIFAGVLKLNNSMNLSTNILTDPYLDCFHNSTSSTLPWYASYFTNALSSSIETIKDENGIQTLFNPGNATNIAARMQHQPVTVTQGEKYILRVNSKTHYPSNGVNFASLNFVLVWSDGDNSQVARQVISLNRSASNTTTPFTEQSAVLVVPTGAVSLSIQPCIATSPDAGATGSQSFYVRSIELLKFNGGTPNTIESLPIRDKRVFTLGSALSGQGTQYNPGDVLEFKTPSTYIGQVCTVAGYGNSATWKNFGAISS